MLGLCFCARAFSGCGERGLLFVAVNGLLIAVASLVVEHGLSSCGTQALECMGFSSCGVQALGRAGFSSCGVWALEHRLSSCGTQT